MREYDCTRPFFLPKNGLGPGLMSMLLRHGEARSINAHYWLDTQCAPSVLHLSAFYSKKFNMCLFLLCLFQSLCYELQLQNMVLETNK